MDFDTVTIKRPDQLPSLKTLDVPGWNTEINFEKLLQESQNVKMAPSNDVSEPHTPVCHTPNYFYARSEIGSVSSIATTDDDDRDFDIGIQLPWSEEQKKIVRDSYYKVVDSPTATPFIGPHPPSGVIHQVCQQSLKLARQRNISFPHSMESMRRYILQTFVNEDQNYKTELGETKPLYFTQDAQPYRRGSVEENFNFFDNRPSKNVYESRIKRHTRPQAPLSLQTEHFQPLQAPFREEQNNSVTENQTDINRRKRDSLNSKRGLN